MYLPKGKYSKPKYSYGGDLEMLDGTPYKGYYFTDQAGNSFTGSKPSASHAELINGMFITICNSRGLVCA